MSRFLIEKRILLGESTLRVSIMADVIAMTATIDATKESYASEDSIF
jgi:hypothetical protein